MRRLLTLATIAVLLLPSLGFSQNTTITEANTFFEQAVDTENHAEATPLLDKALLRYEQLYRDHPTGRLAYNIGNTYYQLDNKPMALVFYKRAKAALPNDNNIQHNLDLVREELHLDTTEPQETTWIPATIQTHKTQLFLIFYGLFWLTACVRHTKKKMMPLIIPIALLFLTLASTTIIGMEYLQPATPEGVIITSDTTGRQGNGRNFEPSFKKPLPIGTECTILEKRGYWLRIQLKQDKECWIPARSCEVI